VPSINSYIPKFRDTLWGNALLRFWRNQKYNSRTTPAGFFLDCSEYRKDKHLFPNWLQPVRGGQGAKLRSNIAAFDAKGRLFVLCAPRRVLSPS
jgi:hypothetical protein